MMHNTSEPTLRGAFDIDANGNGYVTLDRETECESCGEWVRHAGFTKRFADDDGHVVCPECLHVLGMFESNHRRTA